MPDTPRTRTSPSFDEPTLARAVAIGLPLVTVSVAAVVGILVGAATSVLVLAAGVLLGAIALLWGSLRVLIGDAPLPAELEELEMSSRGVDALTSRKEMLLRALKDLENERAIGKIEPEDYAQIAATHREELKALMKKIDASLAPYRARAEAAARAHLARAGLAETGYRGELPSTPPAPAPVDEAPAPSGERIPCPSCRAMNERDAKFCKECATRLVAAKGVAAKGEREPTAQPAGEEGRTDAR